MSEREEPKKGRTSFIGFRAFVVLPRCTPVGPFERHIGSILPLTGVPAIRRIEENPPVESTEEEPVEDHIGQ